jgi:hypothetical protein
VRQQYYGGEVLTRVAVCLVLFFGTGAVLVEAQSRSNDALVRRFFELRERVLDQRGTAAGVNELLSLFKNGGHYEHPAASVSMTLDQAKGGMLAHLGEGRDAKITIHKILHGPNFSVAETTLHYLIPDASGQLKQVERHGVAIFEMEAGKLSRVAEY